MTENGAIQTGSAHPHRDSISHPYAPIPSASNVGNDANEDSYKKTASPEESPLLQRTNAEDGMTKKEGQNSPSSRQD